MAKLFLCIGFAVIALLPLVGAEDCESGWSKFESKCYNFLSSTMMYDACSQECSIIQSNATMLCIESYEQDTFIENHLNGQTHIGLSKSDINGPFTWFEGCYSTYENWHENQPNNYEGDEYYVMMKADSGGNWFDFPDNNNYCACEYALVSPADDDYIPPDDVGDDDGGGSSVAGIVVGVIFGVFIIGTIIFCWCAHIRRLQMAGNAMTAGYGGVSVAPAAVSGHLVPAPYNPQAQSAPRYAAATPAPYMYATAPSPYAPAVPAPSPYAPAVPAPYPYAAVPSTSPYPYTTAAHGAYGAVPVPYAAAQQVEMVYVGSGGQGDYVVADAQVV